MEPVYTWEDNPRPAKRQRVTALPEAADLLPTTLESAQKQNAAEVVIDKPTEASLSTDQLPSELRHLLEQYTFTTMSIISSSKMEQKVRNLLLRANRPAEDGSQTKPGVVILTSKADTASKMISIVEIAKRTIQQEGGDWWQYSKMHSQIIELKKEKKKKTKRAEGGKTLREWAEERSREAAFAPVEAEEEDTGKGLSDGTPAVSEDHGQDEEDDEGAFQTMGRHQAIAFDENRSKLRAIPIMTIYLSRVAVSALRGTCK